jgi:NTP pyrophosphatase (non-canonical NTP hydrolase)
MAGMADDTTTIAELKQLVEAFVAARDWRQFHTPKNLAMALAIEAAELMEHFQWLEPGESRAVADDAAKREAAGEELADVICYVLAMASELRLDVSDAMRAKMKKNAIKYPADEFRGRWGAGDERRREPEA